MKRLKIIIIIALIIIALIVSNIFGVTKFGVNLLQKIFSPIQEIAYSAGLKIKSISQLKTFNELAAENQILKEKLKQTQIDRTELDILIKENELLKKELDLKENSNLNHRVAQIIGRDKFLEYQIFLLNQGESSGIILGLPVILSGENPLQGYLVGKIVETKKNTSKMMLITDSKSQIAAKVNNSQGTSGIIQGERGLTLKMDLIPADKPIKTGDVIVTSGLEENIPEGLLIGEVEEILTQPGDFFSQAKIKYFANLDNLKIVTIILPSINN